MTREITFMGLGFHNKLTQFRSMSMLGCSSPAYVLLCTPKIVCYILLFPLNMIFSHMVRMGNSWCPYANGRQSPATSSCNSSTRISIELSINPLSTINNNQTQSCCNNAKSRQDTKCNGIAYGTLTTKRIIILKRYCKL